MKELVFCVRSDKTGSFLERIAYERQVRIYHALGSAKTWKHFESLLPSGEFEDLALWSCNAGESVYEANGTVLFGDCDLGEDEDVDADVDEYDVISEDDEFFSSQIPGVDEGDYPPFLEPNQEDYLPDEFGHSFGTYTSGFISGSWYEFPRSEFDSLKARLEEEGFTVVLEDDVEVDLTPIVTEELTYRLANPKTTVHIDREFDEILPKSFIEEFVSPLLSGELTVDRTRWGSLASYIRCLRLQDEDDRWRCLRLFHKAQLARMRGGTLSMKIGSQLDVLLRECEAAARRAI